MNQKKNQEVSCSHSEWLQAFQRRQAVKHTPKATFHAGLHPKHTGIGKKDTSFYPGCCHVGFHRKTFPKSGKSIVDGCFVQKKHHYTLVYDIETRCLMGIDVNKIKQYKELLNEIKSMVGTASTL